MQSPTQLRSFVTTYVPPRFAKDMGLHVVKEIHVNAKMLLYQCEASVLEGAHLSACEKVSVIVTLHASIPEHASYHMEHVQMLSPKMGRVTI